MHTIRMISSAHMVKGHGVASCYDEHVRLVRDGLGEKFAVKSGVIDFGSADWAAIAAAPAGGDGHGSGAAGGDGHGSESPCGYACGAAHPLREWAAAPLESLARYSARLLERAHAGFAEQPAAINHYHTVDPHFFLHRQIVGKRAVSVCYVHFLPETVDDSLQIPPMLRQLFYKYLIAFYRSMDYLVVVNPVFAQRLAGYGIDPARVKYIPNYVASEGFSPMAPGEIAQFREGLGLGGGRFTVLGVGQLQRRKGVADFVSAARALPGVQFLWAGGFSFGKLSSGYDEIKAMLGSLPQNIRFLGLVERERMNAVYNASDLLFLPSYSELFPMAILEAAYCEKPLLLRDIGEYPPILFDCYLKGGSVEDFARHIAKLRDDKAEYARWQGKSRQLRAFYGREHILRMWDDFYTKILERAPAGGDLAARTGAV